MGAAAGRRLPCACARGRLYALAAGHRGRAHPGAEAAGGGVTAARWARLCLREPHRSEGGWRGRSCKLRRKVGISVPQAVCPS